MRRIVRITNTSAYPDGDVKWLVRFALGETDADGIEVHVKRSRERRRGWSGAAYVEIPSVARVAPSALWLITMRIGDADLFPQPVTHYGLNGHGPNAHERLVDWREALVYVAAHEARHVDQFAHSWGKGRGEVDAERHAIKMLTRYRKETR